MTTSTQNDTNKVRMGLSNVTVWPKTDDTTWGNPVKIPGAVAFSPSPEGSTDPFYADNGKYHVAISNTGWVGDLEMAKFPDEFYVSCLGWKIDQNGGLVEISDAVPKSFALGFEILGDAHERRNVFYDCTATRPTVDYKTTEDKATPATEKSSITAVPVEFADGTKTARYSLPRKDSNKAVWDTFFDTVVTPAFGTEESGTEES